MRYPYLRFFALDDKSLTLSNIVHYDQVEISKTSVLYIFKVIFRFIYTNVANLFELVPPYKIYVPRSYISYFYIFRRRTLRCFLVRISQRKVFVSTFSGHFSVTIYKKEALNSFIFYSVTDDRII